MKKFISIILVVGILAGCASQKEYVPSKEETNEMRQHSIVAESGEQGYEAVEGDLSLVNDRLSGEEYLKIDENKEVSTDTENVLTFSLKVDTASYSNVTRYIESGNLPPRDAVRVEEMINYFNYDKDIDEGKDFSIYTEIGESPFDNNKKVAMVRVKSKDIDKEELPKSNLTFLIDTSGSMNSYDKLPLLKSAFRLLVDTLGEEDVVSIVTYAGSSSVVLDSVSGEEKDKIIDAIDNLSAGGSTAGAEGILTAYKIAEKNFLEDGNNRVILATDGDFNVGLSSEKELEELISEKRESGVYLSILGFGTGNLKDSKMETLSKHGNGNYGYINSISTAQKVLVDELGSNLFTIANDVKAQVEFNKNSVKNYRLIGYENRMLDNEDFEDDTKDAGEIGVGTDVVLLFELELQEEANQSDEIFIVSIRYKEPKEEQSQLIQKIVGSKNILNNNTEDFNFACSVASFGHILNGSEYGQNLNIDEIIEMAKDNVGEDEKGYRAEFLKLLKNYKGISED